VIELNDDLEIETVDFEEILEDGINININIDIEKKFEQLENFKKIKSNKSEKKEKKCK